MEATWQAGVLVVQWDEMDGVWGNWVATKWNFRFFWIIYEQLELLIEKIEKYKKI